MLSRPEAGIRPPASDLPDLADIKGQESAKRALEVAAAGGHNLLMVGPPGSGKSMLAQRLPSILPPLSPRELLEVSMIASIAGELGERQAHRPAPVPRARIIRPRWRRWSAAACASRPGEVSLAHHGVLFLDEMPEFTPQVLDSLRQPLETGECVIARANSRVSYPGAHPAGGGHEPVPLRHGRRARLSVPARAALPDRLSAPHLRAAGRPHRSPHRGAGGVGRGPDPADVVGKERGGCRAGRAGARHAARALCQARAHLGGAQRACPTAHVAEVAALEGAGSALLHEASHKLGFSARGYHRVLKVARTLADLDGSESVNRIHLAEAISFRMVTERLAQAA